jgi:Phosphotransferase enzyme family
MVDQGGSRLRELVAVPPDATVSDQWRVTAGDELWQLVTAGGTVRFDLPASATALRQLGPKVRALPAGSEIFLTATGLGSRGRLRRFARNEGIHLRREFVAIPSVEPPTCYVEDSRSALRYFITQLLALPRGGAAMSAALAVITRIARSYFPTALIGRVAPVRIALGRKGRGPAAAPGDPGDLSALLDWPGMETVLLAVSKDPNAKRTLLLIPRSSHLPTLAIKVPATRAAAASIAAEQCVLSDLHVRLHGPLLASIPRLEDLRELRGRKLLVTTAMAGSPMTTRYHAWRHLASPAAVRADLLEVESWLGRFQRATAGPRAPVDMDGGSTEILRQRFADDARRDEVLARLSDVHARLATTSTPRTCVHGDFWFGNILFTGDQISGVIDWEAGSASGEPLRDLVRFALTYALYLDRHSRAGHRVAGHRGLWAGEWGAGIVWAVDGEGWFPDLVRDFVRAGMARLGANPRYWREAMLAGLADVAASADHLDFGRCHWQLFASLSNRAAAAARSGMP